MQLHFRRSSSGPVRNSFFSSYIVINLLKYYGEALQSPPISVKSDVPNDTDIIQGIQQEEAIIIEGEPSAASIKAKPKRYRPQAGNANFFQQLPKQNAETSSNLQMFLNTKQMKMSRTFLDIFICFVSKKSSLSDWKLQIQQQKAAQKQKSLREKKGYSDTAECKRKAMNVAVIRNFCFHVDAGKE